MEALRLLSSATASGAFPGLVAEHNVLGDHGAGTRTLGSALPSISGETWDAALLDTHLGDLLSGSNSAIVSPGEYAHERPGCPVVGASTAQQVPQQVVVSRRHSRADA